MSLVAGRTVNTATDDATDIDDGGETVTAGDFWPVIALDDVRREMRINGAVTTERLKSAVIKGVSHVTDQLADWQVEQEAKGYATLAAVPARLISDVSINIHRYRDAVFSYATAMIIENFRDVDTTGDAGEKRAVAMSARAMDLWRDVRWAISDIRGVTRNFAEAF